jgi:tetratricopeptide (TPR) repeat protein
MQMKKIIIALSLVLVIFQLIAQENEIPYPALSPKGNISQTVGNTLIEIEYERPSARKREIFGALVPWNKIWRTGAGNCTKIRFDNEVKVGGQEVPAGNYSVFTIPNPKEWIVILNKDTTLYGSYNYNYENDIARFVVIPTESRRYYETLNIDIELIQHNAKVYISWENTLVSFDIETSTNVQITKLINEELLTGKNQLSDSYAGAASYLFFRGIDLAVALDLADRAIELDENSEWPRYLKIRIYEKLKLYDSAIEEIDKTMLVLKRIESERKNEIRQLKLDYERISKLRE